jgi:hypothetical protein
VIHVRPGTYKKFVTIGIPLSVLGDGAGDTIIDATRLAHGIFVDGFDNPGLRDVTIAALTVRNAQFEGILVVSASDVIVRNNHILDNDKSSGLNFTGAAMGCPDQPGNGTYENDETGDCGGALHLVGVANSLISDNVVTGNADGVLISDDDRRKPPQSLRPQHRHRQSAGVRNSARIASSQRCSRPHWHSSLWSGTTSSNRSAAPTRS